jgi:hypothetical protein
VPYFYNSAWVKGDNSQAPPSGQASAAGALDRRGCGDRLRGAGEHREERVPRLIGLGNCCSIHLSSGGTHTYEMPGEFYTASSVYPS